MKRLGALLTGLLLMGGAAGCRGLAPPDWCHPGTAEQQQHRAHRFDPFMENETGPPVPETRPRGYQIPPAEPGRARWTPRDWVW
jgi:hypothetical protein